jgi:hypothetical protein
MNTYGKETKGESLPNTKGKEETKKKSPEKIPGPAMMGWLPVRGLTYGYNCSRNNYRGSISKRQVSQQGKERNGPLKPTEQG